MLLDSNIAIYACKPGGEALERWTQHPEAATSVVTRIEALGFPGMETEERQRLESFFASVVEHLVDAEVAARAVALRQQRKMRLGDAIIAATALVHDMPLVTRNVADFQHIVGLRLINPFDQP